MLDQEAKVEHLFEEGLERTQGEWVAFLRQESPDNAELRDLVLRLLKAHHESNNTWAPFDLFSDDGDESQAVYADRDWMQSAKYRRRCDESRNDLSETEGQEDANTARGARPAPAKQTIAGYEILRELGIGGMGVVYLARQASLNRLVALKTIRPDARIDDSDIDRFRTEAEAAARLEHENIVTVFEVADEGGVQFYAMRYVPGESLADKLREGPLDCRVAAKYLGPVARAIHEAHQLGILHRDLKPSNILIDEQDRPYVTDFGLAKLTNKATAMTVAGRVFGSPPYMSPEQAEDSSQVDQLTDVYSLGATLYELVTGRPPFQAPSPPEVLRLVMEKEPVPLRQLNSTIDRDMETICLKCLEKDKTRRFGSAADVAEELHRYIDGKPILARPTGPVTRFRKFWLRHPVSMSTAATLLCALLLVTGLAIGFGVNADIRAEAERIARLEESEAKEAEQAARVELQGANGRLRTTNSALQTEILNNYVQLGELASQRGRLSEAIEQYTQAIEGGHPQANALRIKRVEALLGVQEVRRAREEIESILGNSDLANLAGKAWLIRGAIALLSGGSHGKEYLATAIDTGLTPGDQALANALLATDAESMLRYSDEALAFEPFNVNAHRLRLNALLLAGRFDDFEKHASAFQRLYPEDIGVPVIRVVLSSFSADKQAAYRTLRTLEGRLSEDQLGNLRNLVDAILGTVAMFHEGGESVPTPVAVLKAFGSVAGLAASMQSFRQSLHEDDVLQMFRFPSAQVIIAEFTIGNGFLVFSHHEAAAAQYKKVLDRMELAEVRQLYGLTLYEAAIKYKDKDDQRMLEMLREAESSLRRSLDLFSLFGSVIKPKATYLAATVQFEIASLSEPPDEEMRRRAIQSLWSLQQMLSDPTHPGTDLVRRQLTPDLVATATRLGELELARFFASEWGKLAPKSALAASTRAQVELEAGALWLALKATKRALELAPSDGDNRALHDTIVGQITDLDAAAGGQQDH